MFISVYILCFGHTTISGATTYTGTCTSTIIPILKKNTNMLIVYCIFLTQKFKGRAIC